MCIKSLVWVGRWIIAQNANQMIAAGNLPGASDELANQRPWHSQLEQRRCLGRWNQNRGDINAAISTFHHSGVTWLPRNSSQGNLNYSDVAVSADGNRMVATLEHKYQRLHMDLDGFGADWTTQSSSSGSKQWVSIASSADGTKLVQRSMAYFTSHPIPAKAGRRGNRCAR